MRPELCHTQLEDGTQKMYLMTFNNKNQLQVNCPHLEIRVKFSFVFKLPTHCLLSFFIISLSSIEYLLNPYLFPEIHICGNS